VIIALLFIFFLISLYLGLKIYLKLIKDDDGFKADITVKWIAITVFSKKFPYTTEDKKKVEDREKKKKVKEKKAKKSEKKEKSNKEKWEDFKRLYPLIKPNIFPILDFFIVCIDSIKLQKFDTHISLGLSSFSDTAIYTGYIWAFSTVPNLSSHFNLTAEPNFTKEAINFESEIIFNIKLLKPFFAMLKLIVRKSMIRLMWNLRVLI
jgi:hypothetical protein